MKYKPHNSIIPEKHSRKASQFLRVYWSIIWSLKVGENIKTMTASMDVGEREYICIMQDLGDITAVCCSCSKKLRAHVSEVKVLFAMLGEPIMLQHLLMCVLIYKMVIYWL